MESNVGVFERLRNLLRMNLNAAMEKAEDPVKALGLIVEDMRKEIGAARKRVADSITHEKLVKRQFEDAEQEAIQWAERAETAVRSDRDDLAREALAKKAKAAERAASLGPQWESLRARNVKLKSELAAMDERYQDVLRKKEVMVAKVKVAEAQSATASTAPAIFSEESTTMLDRAEEKVRMMEAKAEADRELANLDTAKFDELDQARKVQNIDEELARLKSKVAQPDSAVP